MPMYDASETTRIYGYFQFTDSFTNSNKNMKQKFIMMLAMAAVATGCSKNDALMPEPAGRETPISVKASTRAVETRAPHTDAIAEDTPFKAQVFTTKTKGKYSTAADLYANGTITFTGAGEMAYDDPMISGNRTFPADGSSIYLLGLYPCDDQYAGQKWAFTATAATYKFSGKEDVITAKEVKTTKKADADAGTFETLEFEHQLTLLEVHVVAETEEAAKAWGTLKEVALTHNLTSTTFKNTVSVNTSTGTATISSTPTATGWPVYTADDATFTGQTLDIPYGSEGQTTDELKTMAQNIGTTLVAPIVAKGTSDFTMTIKSQPTGANEVTKDGIKIDLKSSDGTAFTGNTKGQKFVVTLIFRSQDIKAVGTLTPWGDGGSADADVN